MIICQLGRQPEMSLAELDALYPGLVNKFGHEFAVIDTAPDQFNIQKIGGVQKAGVIKTELADTSWEFVSEELKRLYIPKLKQRSGKITLGISAYGLKSARPPSMTKLGLSIKNKLKSHDVSVRLIPNKSPVLSTATSHHNKLGLSDNKIEIMVIKAGSKVIIAESLGTQNITAYAKRDQARPARDAFVGMLPPKLAQIMINIALGDTDTPKTILDPFCGTGVILQEALLMRHTAYGSDLSEKMVDYTTRNINWLSEQYRHLGDVGTITQGDAITNTWNYAKEIDAVVCEGYLGQPFSATPSPAKLTEVRNNCNHIMISFLNNIISQITPGTKLAVAVPAWRNLKSGQVTRLPLTQDMNRSQLYKSLNKEPLLYYRQDQVVARDILILEKK